MSRYKTVFYASVAGVDFPEQVEESVAGSLQGTLDSLKEAPDGRYTIREELWLCHDADGHDVKEEAHRGTATVERGIVTHYPDREWRD